MGDLLSYLDNLLKESITRPASRSSSGKNNIIT